LGGVYLKFSQPAKAIDYYQQSLMIKESIGFKQSSINTLNNIAKAYLLQKIGVAHSGNPQGLELSKKLAIRYRSTIQTSGKYIFGIEQLS
jgi:tetratricopeptide (TPR) repeat protein